MKFGSAVCTALVSLSIMLAAPLSLAEKPGQGHQGGPDKAERGYSNKGERDDDSRVEVTVSLLPPLVYRDRERIREYIRLEGVPGDPRYPGGKAKSLPPGLQKKLARGGNLPPGWQKKVARGQVLSPDLRRHGYVLPPDLNRRLDGYSDGVELLVLEDRVVRILEGRGTVLDVIDIADIMLR